MLLVIGCTEKKPDAPPPNAETPAQALADLFRAFREKDCAAVRRRIDGALERRFHLRGGCKKLFSGEDPLTRARFGGVVSVKTDGRTRRRHLVRFRLTRDGQSTEITAQMEWREGRYRVLDL